MALEGCWTQKSLEPKFQAFTDWLNRICLQNLYVFCLEAFGPLNDVELDCLAFLKAPETIRLNCRKVHEDVFAVLAADESKSLGVVKPLHCSLFHCVVPFCIEFPAEKIGCY